ncbi:MAG TPA: hypothetical protein DCW52_11995 [Gammaproteobacteria bacterium]|nr:hypothetical protein [Gammaproteobacteria bacterium]
MGNSNNNIEDLLDLLRPHYGTGLTISPVAGGDCHKSYRLDCEDGRHFFMKTNTPRYLEVLASEHFSLCKVAALLGGVDALYPEVEGYIEEAGVCCLVLEWRELGTFNESNGAAIANSLFNQHAISADRYGWEESNFLGLTKQNNNWNISWADFFLTERLMPQAKQAKANGMPVYLLEQVKRTCENAHTLLQSHQPTPSLLHGDLWTGNVSWDIARDEPCLYDPAPYFGDPEVDIAMSRLFGQLPASFYKHYYTRYGELPNNNAAPDEPSSELKGVRLERELAPVQRRAQVYNLLHALNHFNLFGGGYLSMVESHLFQ